MADHPSLPLATLVHKATAYLAQDKPKVSTISKVKRAEWGRLHKATLRRLLCGRARELGLRQLQESRFCARSTYSRCWERRAEILPCGSHPGRAALQRHRTLPGALGISSHKGL